MLVKRALLVLVAPLVLSVFGTLGVSCVEADGEDEGDSGSGASVDWGTACGELQDAILAYCDETPDCEALADQATQCLTPASVDRESLDGCKANITADITCGGAGDTVIICGIICEES